MKLTTKQLKSIIQEELASLLTENTLMPWAQQMGVREDTMYDMLMVPGAIDMMSMLMKNGFQLKASEAGEMTWVGKAEQEGFLETIQLQFAVPKDDQQQTVLYRASADQGFLKSNPFEKTFDNYEEAIDFVNWRFAGMNPNTNFGV